jgi:hypothetical protein
VEIVCGQRAAARRALREDPLVRSVEVFGEALHALVASADAIPELKKRLDAARIENVRLREIAPSLEDTFVARLMA